MDLHFELKALAGIKGSALAAAKQKILDEMSPDDLRRFLAVADADELKKLSKLDYWPSQKEGSEREVGFYEAVRDEALASRLKPASAVALLRMKTNRLLPESALAVLERHPDCADALGNLVTVGQFRRGCALLTAIPADAAAELRTLEASPAELARSDARALAKFGITWKDAPAVLEFPRVFRSGSGEWSGKDPHGSLVPGRAAWLVAKAATFPTHRYRFKFRSWDSDLSSLELGSGGENIDTMVNGVRVILAPIGYVPEAQCYLCVDLTQETHDLRLYTIDHDGTGAGPYSSSLASLLSTVVTS